jgi:hypothetical protein
MATGIVNESNVTPRTWKRAATAAKLSADYTLVESAKDLCYRRIIVGVIVDALTLYDHTGAEQVWSVAEMNAVSGVLDGQWTGIKTGSNSYDFRCGQ